MTVVWRAWVVSRWSWADDDWVYLANTRSKSFWDYLFQNYNSHLMPGEFFVQWVVTKVAPLEFWPAVVLVAAASGVSVWLWGLAAAELAGERLVLLVPQALLGLSPLLIHPVSWWASALQVLPFQISAALVVLYAARLARGGDRRDLLRLLLALVGGLVFWEKCVLLVIPAVAVLLHVPTGPWRRRIRAQATSILALGAVAATYLVGYVVFVHSRPDQGANRAGISLGGRSLSDVAGFFWRGFADLLAPAVLGGPWGSLPTPGTVFERPPAAVSFVSAGLVLAAVAWALRRLVGAWLVLVMVVVYIAVSWGLVLFSARFVLMGSAVVNQERYLADALLLVVLAAAMLVGSPVRGRPSSSSAGTTTRSRVVTGTTVVALAASLFVGDVMGVRTLGTQPGRAWVRHLTADVHRDAPVTLLDAYAPAYVLPPAYWADDAKLSRMLAPLEPDVAFNGPADQLWLVADDGHLHKLVVAEAARTAPGPVTGCGYSVAPGQSVSAPMTRALFALDWVVQVDTLTADGGSLTVTLDGQGFTFDVAPGLTQHQFAYRGAVGSAVTLSMSPESGTTCVTDVLVGNPMSQ